MTTNAFLRRLGLMLLTVVGVVIGTFFIARVIPADPAILVAGQNASDEVLAATRRKLGLDQPLHVQFSIYLKLLGQGDLGTSHRTGKPVFAELRHCLPATIELATVACLLSICLGLPLGIVSAVKKDSWSDHLIRMASLVGVSIPIFFLGFGSLFIFYKTLNWCPPPGRLSLTVFPQPPISGILLLDSLLHRDFDVFWDALRHLLLPALILGYVSSVPLLRITRASLLAVLQQEYIQTARAKGLSEIVVICHHALRNALFPILTTSGLIYGYLLEGSVITETIFHWNGIGRYIVSAMLESDYNAVLGGVLVTTLLFVTINAIIDLLYVLCNPLIHYE